MSGSVRGLGPVAVTLGLALLLGGTGCDSRFTFDENGVAGGGASAGASLIGGGGSKELGGSAGQNGGASAAAGAAATAMAGTAGASDGDDCGSPGCPAPLHCDDGACVECDRDSDCAVFGLARCDHTRHRCVSCLEASDCPDGFACDALANRCLEKCQEDANCPVNAHGCDEARLVCYRCDEDSECTGSPLGALCASDGSGCVQCRKSSDCPGKHCDQLTGKCVACRDSTDCASGACNPNSHTCL